MVILQKASPWIGGFPFGVRMLAHFFMIHCARAVADKVALSFNRRFLLFRALLPLFTVALFSGISSPAAESCVLVEKAGKVDIARKGSNTWAPAQLEDKLQPGDRLRTGLRSRATLRWSELSVVRVSELTSMELQPPPTGGDKPQLELKSGATYFFSRERPGEIHFQTPVASGAIRGTEFHLAVE